jgi:hypothetical protein
MQTHSSEQQEVRSEKARKDEDMNDHNRALSQAAPAATKALLGVVFALGSAYPAGVAYAQSCGCSGSACGGCTITVSGTNCSCSVSCDECIIFSSGDCTTGWQCP